MAAITYAIGSIVYFEVYKELSNIAAVIIELNNVLFDRDLFWQMTRKTSGKGGCCVTYIRYILFYIGYTTTTLSWSLKCHLSEQISVKQFIKAQ